MKMIDYKTIKVGGYTYLMHRKVWEDANGSIPKDMMIHHINGNKHDNRIENLRCVTREEHGLFHRKPNRVRIIYPSGAVKVSKIIQNK